MPKHEHFEELCAAASIGQGSITLIELIVATTILMILIGMAIPLVRVTIQREREHELRYDLWMMRDAIDRCKDAADRGAFQMKMGSEGYPPDLETREWDGCPREKAEVPA